VERTVRGHRDLAGIFPDPSQNQVIVVLRTYDVETVTNLQKLRHASSIRIDIDPHVRVELNS
jgi:hypothetical protein